MEAEQERGWFRVYVQYNPHNFMFRMMIPGLCWPPFTYKAIARFEKQQYGSVERERFEQTAWNEWAAQTDRQDPENILRVAIGYRKPKMTGFRHLHARNQHLEQLISIVKLYTCCLTSLVSRPFLFPPIFLISVKVQKNSDYRTTSTHKIKYEYQLTARR